MGGRVMPLGQSLEFIDEMIAEAESETGTWCLATYIKLRRVIHQFPPSLINIFVTRIFRVLFAEDTAITTRYKLSQICSAIHTFGIPEFDRLFKEHEAQINDVCSKIDPKYLGFPTVQYLQALTRDKRVPTIHASRKIRIGGFSQPPKMSEFEPRAGHIASSKTPDPQNHSC